jgi:putative toxin-antitoxin system antitoxin component (TIGR02293 family)
MKADIWTAMSLLLSDTETDDYVDGCLPFMVFERVAKAFSMNEKMLGKHLGVPPRRLSRVARAGHFSCRDSRRLAALIRILLTTYELFDGDAQAASLFLTSLRALNSRTPIEMFSTEDGATAVTDLVGRLENGIPL